MEKRSNRRVYLIIWIVTTAAALVIALTCIPYFGNDWGDTYFVWIRTGVLLVSWLFHSLFISFHYHLYTRPKKLWIIISISVHIALTVLSFPFAIFCWTCI